MTPDPNPRGLDAPPPPIAPGLLPFLQMPDPAQQPLLAPGSSDDHLTAAESGKTMLSVEGLQVGAPPAAWAGMAA